MHSVRVKRLVSSSPQLITPWIEFARQVIRSQCFRANTGLFASGNPPLPWCFLRELSVRCEWSPLPIPAAGQDIGDDGNKQIARPSICFD